MPRDHAPFVARTAAELDALEPAWRALTASAPPNAQPALVRAAAATIDDCAPIVIGAGPRDAPHAIVIGRRSTHAVRSRVGYLHLPAPRVRCLDVVYGGVRHDDRDDSRAAAHALLAELPALADVDAVTFNHLDDATRFALPAHAVAHGARDLHWTFTYEPGPWSATHQRFSKKHRYNLRRNERRLDDALGAPARPEVITTPDAIDAYFDAATTIARAGWQASIGAATIGAPIRAVCRAAATHGAFRGFVLHGPDAPIACHCSIRVGSTAHVIAMSFDPAFAAYSPGQMLHVQVLAALRDEGVERIDYGFGDAPYKRTYGTESTTEQSVVAFAPTARGALARTWLRATESARRHAVRSPAATRLARRWWRRALAPERRAA